MLQSATANSLPVVLFPCPPSKSCLSSWTDRVRGGVGRGLLFKTFAMSSASWWHRRDVTKQHVLSCLCQLWKRANDDTSRRLLGTRPDPVLQETGPRTVFFCQKSPTSIAGYKARPSYGNFCMQTNFRLRCMFGAAERTPHRPTTVARAIAGGLLVHRARRRTANLEQSVHVARSRSVRYTVGTCA